MQVKLDIFRVVRFAGNSWLLVEHPAVAKEYASWVGKHRAALHLEQADKLDADRLTFVKQSAAKEIKLTQTWINIDHAITIKPVSKESLGITED